MPTLARSDNTPDESSVMVLHLSDSEMTLLDKVNEEFTNRENMIQLNQKRMQKQIDEQTIEVALNNLQTIAHNYSNEPFDGTDKEELQEAIENISLKVDDMTNHQLSSVMESIMKINNIRTRSGIIPTKRSIR